MSERPLNRSLVRHYSYLLAYKIWANHIAAFKKMQAGGCFEAEIAPESSTWLSSSLSPALATSARLILVVLFTRDFTCSPDFLARTLLTHLAHLIKGGLVPLWANHCSR
jgi:hypothetical protein